MRLTSTIIRPSGTPISFRFDGKTIDALEGETIAAALSAVGIVTLRTNGSGAVRGLYCGIGACMECVVTVDGRIGQRACLVKVAEGMEVAGAVVLPLVALAAAPKTPGPAEHICDVLIVGAGPAGLSAALAAREAGADVIVLDERAAIGGQYHKPLADSHTNLDPDPQFAEGAALRAQVLDAHAVIITDALVWGAFSPHEVAAVVEGQAVVFRPKKLILATGAHERPMPLAGWTLPGVMTTGALQTLARAQRVSPGQRVLIAGNGPLNIQLATELIDGGVEIVAVLEAAPRPGFRGLATGARMFMASPALTRQGLRLMRRLRRHAVDVLWGSTVVSAEGDGRVQRVTVATPSGPKIFAVDVLAMNMGFQPETGLARALDADHRFVDVGLGHLATVADPVGRTSVADVFAVGDGAALGGSRVAMARGWLAGQAAAGELGDAVAPDARALRDVRKAEQFQAALWTLFRPPAPEAIADDTIVCRCEDVTAGRVRQEIAGGLVSIAAIKRATRAGMGRCQGRFCSATIARICPQAPAVDSFAAPRFPVKPVPAAALMFEAPEFEAPLLGDLRPNRRVVPVAGGESIDRACDILVIGGGCVGLSAAYYLAREGADVLIVDRDEAGMAAATANAGSLHVQLLSYDFGHADMPDDGGPAAHTLPLGPQSIALWKEIAAAAGESLGIATKGGLMLAAGEADMVWLRGKAAMEKRWGIETHVIGPDELRGMAPHLAGDLHGAVYCPAEGRIDPLRGTMALLKLAQQHGARVLRGAEVAAMSRDGNGWQVETSKGRIRAGRVVNCAGALGAGIGAMVGLDLPVTGTVQQVIVTEPAPRLVEHLVALSHRHLSLKQQDSGGLLIGGGWFGSYDPRDGRTRNLRENIQGNLWVAARVLPALRGLSIIRSWTGINAAIDRAPLLGEVPGQPGFFNALTANGYTLGPISGRLVADAVLRGAEIAPYYRVDRFNA